MQPDRISFVVPGQPVGKGRPRFVRATGHSFTPAKTRSYEAVAMHFAAEAMKGRQPFQGACAVEVVAYMPIPRSWSQKKQLGAIAGNIHPTGKPDSDNLLKCIGDALNGIVWRDDSQAVECRVVKRYSHQARCEVSVVHIAAPDRGVVIVPLEDAARRQEAA